MSDWMSEVGKCTSCGLCAAACPSYRADPREANSPRGRVHLMARSAVEPELGRDLAAALHDCPGCNACSAVCPTGVDVLAALLGWAQDRGSAAETGTSGG